jgi:hypothetical protein
VQQNGWKDPNDPIKNCIELEKALGNRVKLPSPESSAEEVSAFYAKIGRPDNPDGYEIADVPGNVQRDEEFENFIKGVAHEQGVSKTALETVMKAYYTRMSEQLVATKTAGETTLKEEWKDKYDTNLEIAQRACKELGGEDFMAALDQTGLGNHPVFVKTFHNIGLKMLDDSLVSGSPSGSGKEEYVPQFKDSPEMYANGDDEESKKAREYFKKKGHVY